jgi:carboxypeptidase Taq
MPSYYDQFKEKMTKITDIYHSIAVLHWDKETYIPSKGAAIRSQQIATLSGIAHNEFVDPKFGRLLTRLLNMTILSDIEMKNVELTMKDYKKATKYTDDFVKKKSMAVSAAFQDWMKAREANDYSIYVPSLQKLIEIIREEAEIAGYQNHPYDACLDNYEPDMTVEILDNFFTGVRRDLKPLIDKIKNAPKVENSFLKKHFPKDQQWDFGISLLKNMGYDFEAGRQDISTHPFTISFSPQDVRVTTRIDENDFLNMTWSCIHEGGHALYEQGLPVEEYGLPSGQAVSLSIHESQSRMWENNVGRNKEYWKFIFPILQQKFPKQFKKISINKFFKGINTVRPNLIRTEADELHYHMHVLIRYEIEKLIMENQVQAEGLKELWNDKYEEYLGVRPADDLTGILQDIHWSHGSIGYFPTYSLGSFYAAQFFNAAENAIPKLTSQLNKGKTEKLLNWLRENIHSQGRKYNAEELCEKVTGERLNTDYFLNYATNKYSEVYDLGEKDDLSKSESESKTKNMSKKKKKESSKKEDKKKKEKKGKKKKEEKKGKNKKAKEKKKKKKK